MHESGLYLNDWQGKGLEGMLSHFSMGLNEIGGVEILLASYRCDDLCGEAFVLFRKGKTLFEVNASHDSSDGMEGQWEPEETLVAALRYRLERGRLGSAEGGINVFGDELGFLLTELEVEGYR